MEWSEVFSCHICHALVRIDKREDHETYCSAMEATVDALAEQTWSESGTEEVT